MTDHFVLVLALYSGETCRDARLVYQTHGMLNADRSNAIVCQTAVSSC